MKKLFIIATVILLCSTVSTPVYAVTHIKPDITAFQTDIDSNKIWTNIVIVNKSYDPYYEQGQNTNCVEALVTRNVNTKKSISGYMCD